MASLYGNVIPGLSIPEHDHITLDPPSQPNTITYRQGGPSGTIVCTLALTYDGNGNVASIAKS